MSKSPFKPGDDILIPATVISVNSGQYALPYEVKIVGPSSVWAGRLYTGNAYLASIPKLRRGPRIPQNFQLVPPISDFNTMPRILLEALPDVQLLAFKAWMSNTGRNLATRERPSAWYADYVTWYCEHFQREVVLQWREGGSHE